MENGKKQLRYMENTLQLHKEIIILVQKQESGTILLMKKLCKIQNNYKRGNKQFVNNQEIGCSFSYLIFKQPNISDDILCLTESFLLYENQRFTQSCIFYLNQFLQHGNHLQGGIKDGKWVELEQNSFTFDKQKQFQCFICSKGKYVQGMKEDIWESIFYQKFEHQIDENSVSKGVYRQGKKTGIWTEPIDYQLKANILTTITGSYTDDLKHGIWKLYETESVHESNELCQYEGTYQKGIKINNWIEVRLYQDYQFKDSIYIQDKGIYNNDGKRHKEWVSQVLQYKGRQNYVNGVLDGEAVLFDSVGNYSIKLTRSKGLFQNGIKNGKWKKSISVDEKWILFEVGEYLDDKKIGLWRESQYFDQYNLERYERDRGQFLLIKQGYYGNDGIKEGQWKWRFKSLNSYYDESYIFKIGGIETYNGNTISGNLILFEKEFDNFQARLNFCDIFNGEIVNGYRNGEWKFLDLSELQQTEIDLVDSDSEQEQEKEGIYELCIELEQNENNGENQHDCQNQEENDSQQNEEQNEDQNEEQNENQNEEQNESQDIQQDQSITKNEEEIIEEDPKNKIYKIYNNGIVIEI